MMEGGWGELNDGVLKVLLTGFRVKSQGWAS